MFKKKKNYILFSKLSEYFVILILWCKGYHIVKHRYRNNNGEIDIIAKKKNLIIAVEVKFRKNISNLYHSITSEQQYRISNTLDKFLMRSLKFKNYNIRYDAFLLSFKSWPKHIKNAW